MMDEKQVRELIVKLKREIEGDPDQMGKLYYRGMVRVLKFVLGEEGSVVA